MCADGLCLLSRYGYYEQGGLADMPDDVRVMELVEDTVSRHLVLLCTLWGVYAKQQQ